MSALLLAQPACNELEFPDDPSQSTCSAADTCLKIVDGLLQRILEAENVDDQIFYRTRQPGLLEPHYASHLVQLKIFRENAHFSQFLAELVEVIIALLIKSWQPLNKHVDASYLRAVISANGVEKHV